MLAATLLTDQEVLLDEVPRIADVDVMLEILEFLGADVEWRGPNTLSVTCANIESGVVSRELSSQLRASILLAGPLLARVGSVTLPPPGGDVIGRRRLDTHFLGLEALGATISNSSAGFLIESDGLIGADILLDEPSVTGTENIIMAAVLASGTTIIRNAACEPHVSGLCRLLNAMGAKISGVGTNQLLIEGVEKLGAAQHKISSDYLEIGSIIGLAAMTGSAIEIDKVVEEDLRMIRLVFSKIGVNFSLEDGVVRVPAHEELRIQTDFGQRIPQIDDAPWPAFPTDMMSIVITVATQAVGTVLFFEKMFDGRMFFTDSLVGMGAQIILCDPHRVVVTGPAPLVGARLASPDVRAGMALVLAALSAEGTSVINNIRHIDRGYERIDEKLRALGAKIERQ